MTIIYIIILTEDSWNGVHRTTIYITISTEILWNGVQITIIDITIGFSHSITITMQVENDRAF